MLRVTTFPDGKKQLKKQNGRLVDWLITDLISDLILLIVDTNFINLINCRY